MTTYPAPAKLNLFLHVVGRRDDGYHLLQTVFRFIEYSDRLGFEITSTPGIELLNPIPGIPPESDLCVRAARLLQLETGCGLGAKVSLEKNLPMGGGLGGGSSDAATTLIVLNKLWDLNLDRKKLQTIALKLGADVPVFVFGDNAFAEGIGERLTPVSLVPAWYLVLVPPVLIPTAEIFTHEELTRNTNPIRISDFSIKQGHNDLEPVACSLHPVVAEHLAWLGRFGRAAMTGSGSCVFAEFRSEFDARRALSELPDSMQGFVARGLDHHPLKNM
jgi:4-diphosphocytidyl-2-C-methyl-D-erythritol kinase